MFDSRKDLTERIAVLETRTTELESELIEATTEATANAQTAQEAVAAKEAAQAELLEDQAKLITSEAAVATLTSENAELEKALSDDASRIVTESAKQLAEIGHPPVEVSDDEVSTKSASKIREEFDAMESGPERSAFYQANRLVLSK
tara:strand:+ start:759 stop:1199 length:441 start_codon:yes stop_codon:yes gene_type:complete